MAAVESNLELGDEEVALPAVTFAECPVGPAKMDLLDKAAEELQVRPKFTRLTVTHLFGGPR